MGKPIATVPAPRFTKEGWDLVLERWQDKKPRMTYDEHLAQEKALADALRAQNIAVEEIDLDARKMLSWLKKEKLKNDGRGRSAYLAEVAKCRNTGRPEPE
jgi:hypothetical protein